jgi:hypothetical protein
LPVPTPATVLRRLTAHLNSRVASWRTGSSGSQTYVLCVLLLLVAGTFTVSWTAYDVVPLTVWFVLLLLGLLLLNLVPLLLLSGYVLMSAVAAAVHGGMHDAGSWVGMATLVVAVALMLYHSSRQRSGLPVALSEPMLAKLRDKLQSAGQVPDLPPGWRSQKAALTAHGTGYAGDFVVADLSDRRHLEMVLVDVCGSGSSVGPQSLQFSGALGGLLGALPPVELMQAANAFLLRQYADESFATAVHVLIDLETGTYVITSAGHPPALHWRTEPGGWFVDNASGTALGIIPDPPLTPSWGHLEPGEALMFYTDGVVETRGGHLDEGVEWLRDAALHAVLDDGFEGAAERILRRVKRGDDDRAVLILERLPA